MDDKNSPELTQYISTAVAVACAITSMIAFNTQPKWRKYNHVHAKQMFLKGAASCCILTMFFIPEDMNNLATVIFLAIVITTALGTAQTVGLGHLHAALKCEDIADEETVVTTSWFYMTSVTCITLFLVMNLLKLDLENLEYIGAVLLFALSSGNIMMLSRLFKNIGKCDINVALMFLVNTLGILGDVLLVLYAIILLIIGNSSGLIYDVVVGTFTGTMFVQTILILFSKDALDWKNCRPRDEEAIEM